MCPLLLPASRRLLIHNSTASGFTWAIGTSLRPDRIILGEIRGGEAFDLLQLLNTGHSGTISTVHANSAAQGISRFTTCVLQSGIEIPYIAVKTNIAESLDVIVHIERRPGQRRVAEVLALRGFDPDLDKYNFDFVYQYRVES